MRLIFTGVAIGFAGVAIGGVLSVITILQRGKALKIGD
jgi:hypothetical protein